ncbi:deacetylase [Lithospermum erythrorhizon]|uniref:Deacetylase n=1 Tax=Lithospermum erythrorhizon TaxID=34254 RepID=A0AAV3RGY7_LITER
MALKWLQDQTLSVDEKDGLARLAPVRMRGYVHLEAGFGGTVRTQFEAQGPKDSFLNLDKIDRYWRLALPLGETTDHPLVNPFDPILAIMGGDDLLRDRVREYVEKLKSWGKKIEYVEFEGKQHGFVALDPNSEAAKEVVIKLIKNFIIENSG